jgi:hypothetical protein
VGVDDDDGSKSNDDAAMVVVVVRLAKRRLESSSSSPRVVVLGKERTFFQHITPLLPMVDRQTDRRKKKKIKVAN